MEHSQSVPYDVDTAKKHNRRKQLLRLCAFSWPRLKDLLLSTTQGSLLRIPYHPQSSLEQTCLQRFRTCTCFYLIDDRSASEVRVQSWGTGATLRVPLRPLRLTNPDGGSAAYLSMD